MPWAIRWTQQAFRDLSRLDTPVARRIVSRLDQAAVDPPHFFTRLVGADEYKLRIGDYRLLAVLAHDTETIIVERVDHRSRVYRR